MDNNNNQSDKEKIANRLKEARTLSGLSQAQTADMINLPRATISEIESGKRRVSADELIQFANMYRVDTSWILHEETDSDLKFAARELGKLSKEDRDKVLAIMKMFPKKNTKDE